MKIMVFALLAVVIISGCSSKMPEANISNVANTTTTATEMMPAYRTIGITAFNWGFNPSSIQVNQGDKVRLVIYNRETVAHGFAISEYEIFRPLTPRTTTVIEFTATKKGIFSFYCNIPCGSGHSAMRGELIVN